MGDYEKDPPAGPLLVKSAGSFQVISTIKYSIHKIKVNF